MGEEGFKIKFREDVNHSLSHSYQFDGRATKRCPEPGKASQGIYHDSPTWSAAASSGAPNMSKRPVWRRVMKMIKGLEDLSYEGRQREQGLFSLEKTRLCGDLLAAFQYLKRPYRIAGNGLLTRACRDSTWGECY